MPRALRWSQGGGVFFERGTPIHFLPPRPRKSLRPIWEHTRLSKIWTANLPLLNKDREIFNEVDVGLGTNLALT